MTKKKSRTNWFKMFTMVSIFSTQLSCNKNMAIELDVKDWSNNTIEFIEVKCGINTSDVIRLGDENMPVKIGENIYYTINDYIASKLKSRIHVANFLQEKYLFTDAFYAFEMYDRDLANIIIAVNNSNSFNFSYRNDSLMLNEIKETDDYDSLFAPLNEEEKDCFEDFIHIPRYIHIFSQYNLRNKKMETYQVSMYD